MLWMPCSSLLIHLAKTLVSLLTESSQLFGLTSLSASIVANSKRFFPDIGPAVLKRRFIRHKALTFQVETFFLPPLNFFKCFAHLRKFQSLLSSSTNQFSLLMCPRGVWSVSADSRNGFRQQRPSILTGVCQPRRLLQPVWMNLPW